MSFFLRRPNSDSLARAGAASKTRHAGQHDRKSTSRVCWRHDVEMRQEEYSQLIMHRCPVEGCGYVVQEGKGTGRA